MNSEAATQGAMPSCYNHPGRATAGFCVSCGKPVCSECIVEVNDKYYCKACVAQQFEDQATATPTTVVVRKRKKPGVAASLSFFIIGAGQLYIGQVVRGLVFIFIMIASLPFFPWSLLPFFPWNLPSSSWVMPLLPWNLFWLSPLWIFSTLDAYDYAKKLNAGEID